MSLSKRNCERCEGICALGRLRKIFFNCRKKKGHWEISQIKFYKADHIYIIKSFECLRTDHLIQYFNFSFPFFSLLGNFENFSSNLILIFLLKTKLRPKFYFTGIYMYYIIRNLMYIHIYIYMYTYIYIYVCTTYMKHIKHKEKQNT